MSSKDEASQPEQDADLPVIEAEPVSGDEERPDRDAGAATRSAGGNGRVLALWLMVLLLLAAAGAGGWLGWQQLARMQNQVAEQAQALSTLQQSLAEDRKVQDARMDALAQQLQSLQGRDQARIDALERRVETLQQSISSARELVTRAERDWVVAEVAHLIRMANQRLRLMRDYEGAIAALQAADARLRDLADPALLPVRERLAEDIRRLRDAPRPDLVGIALRLDRMVAHLKPLPLKLPTEDTAPAGGEDAISAGAQAHVPAGENDAQAPSPTTTQGWRAMLADAWTRLRARVTVRHYDENVQNLPDREREMLLAQLLRLRLEAARVDVLRQDDADYHRQLRAAIKLIDSYYRADATHPLRAEIEELDAINLRPPLPDVSEALTLLQRIEGARRLKAGDSAS
ncbi:MAG: hypothetical protein D6717_08590 [Gammaproteobacteria bacterium]|nr:MAG: hypothetical protein D6717_08590 [Gammaproteobacteria bacterium]